MNQYQTRETEEGTEIRVKTQEKVAIIVQGESERIFLPDVNQSEGSYYVEKPGQLQKTPEGYQVLHQGVVNSIEVIGYESNEEVTELSDWN